MKIYQIFIFFSLIILIKNRNYCLRDVSASKGDDCKNLEITSLDYHCCYVKGKVNGIIIDSCMEIKPWEYKDLKKHIEESNKDENNDIEKIDCKSFYLQVYIFYLIFILL